MSAILCVQDVTFTYARRWRFGMAPEQVAAFLQTYDWRELEQMGSQERTARYIEFSGRKMPVSEVERAVYAQKIARVRKASWSCDGEHGLPAQQQCVYGERFHSQSRRRRTAMITAKALTQSDIRQPINLGSSAFSTNKYAYYRWLREEAPVCKGRIAVISTYLLSRYEDCVGLLKDQRFVRNRTTATGGGRLPFPTPKTIRLISQNMILEDEPNHRRLRSLVHKAFTPRALARLEGRIDRLTHELLDVAERQRDVDLIASYALPIPVTVIREMVGVSDKDMPTFREGVRALSGLSGWTLFRALFWDLPRTNTFVRELIARKRADPQDDILTGLIQAEEAGDRLSEDELVSMVFLLIFAGYETTVHLITNSVEALLRHPDQLARLRARPELMESAVEEILRYNGPIQGTKPAYALEDVTLHGVTIPKGAAVIPLLGAANHDPAVFERPEEFDITRSPNRHLGFGQGMHYCLGAPLARMETRIALKNVLERNPNLRLAVRGEELKIQNVPLWHRYERLPVTLG